jgi:hypothetical protein
MDGLLTFTLAIYVWSLFLFRYSVEHAFTQALPQQANGIPLASQILLGILWSLSL